MAALRYGFFGDKPATPDDSDMTGMHRQRRQFVMRAVIKLSLTLTRLRAPVIATSSGLMKKLVLAAAVLIFAAIGAVLAWQHHDNAAAAADAASARIALRIHGSNTVGESLMPALVSAFLTQQGYALVRTETGADPVEKTVLARVHASQPDVAVAIHAHGSTTAFVDLGNGSTDLGMSSRRIKPEEQSALLASHGDLMAPEHEHVIALDALAIISHPDNPLQRLTIAQIAQIFSGEISDWAQLGGNPGAISLYTRDDNSGTYDTFKELVLKKNDKKLAANARRFESSEALTEAVRRDPQGIGFVGVAYASRIKLIAVSADGEKPYTVPEKHQIGTESYALSRRLYVYEPASLDNALAKDFLRFAVSDEGQKLVEAIGLISYYPTRDKPRVALQPFPARYQSLGTLGERLSVSFQLSDSSLLDDSKSRRDLDRVANFFRDHPDKRLVLAQMSPPTGSRGGNDPALGELVSALAARKLQPYDTVKVEYGPDHFDALAGQVEIWAL